MRSEILFLVNKAKFQCECNARMLAYRAFTPIKEPRVVMVDVELCGTISLGAAILLWNTKSTI